MAVRRLANTRSMRPSYRACLRVVFGLAALPGLAGLAPSDAWAQSGPQHLPTIRLSAGISNITVEVADTPDERAVGLMFRTEMPANNGMLFVFEREGRQCFWMRNTLIPLSVAFLDEGGRIVNVEEMQPQRDDSHCSAAPVRFVLEMNAQWFTKHGLKAGDRVAGPVFGAPR